MTSKNIISTVVISLFVFGFVFLTLPEKGYSGTGIPTFPPVIGGCCQYLEIAEAGSACAEVVFEQCPAPPPGFAFDDFRTGESCVVETGRCERPAADVPTLSEWGLIAMAGILGIVGFMIIRRRKQVA